MPGDFCTVPGIISLASLSLATDVTDATLGASGLWLGTRRGAGGTATLTERFFGRSPWLHRQQDTGVKSVTVATMVGEFEPGVKVDAREMGHSISEVAMRWVYSI